MPNKKLLKNILATIAYYDGFSYPLTSFEIWKHLLRSNYFESEQEKNSVEIIDVLNELENDNLCRYVENKNGFYFLKGKDFLVEKRILADKLSSDKIKKIRKYVLWMKCIPFVRMIAVTGALAMKNAKNSSDLDVLIVLKSGKIWTGRTLITAVAFLLGKWRHKNKIKNRICLNCFITDKSLEMITKDLFSASEYMFIFPIFGWRVFNRFQIKNRWISSIKPNYFLEEVPPLKMVYDGKICKNIKKNMEKILSLGKLEDFLRKLEKRKIMKNPKTHKEGSFIYADDCALIFFPNPKGPRMFEKFKDNIEKIGL